MKAFVQGVFAYALMVLFAASAILASDGMAFTIDGMAWVTKAADIIGNFVPVFAVISLLIGAAVVALALVAEEFFEKIVSQLREKGTLEKGLKNSRFKWHVFIPSAIYWIILIAAGWIFSALCYIIGAIGIYFYQFLLHQAIEEEIGKTPEEIEVDEQRARIKAMMRGVLDK